MKLPQLYLSRCDFRPPGCSIWCTWSNLSGFAGVTLSVAKQEQPQAQSRAPFARGSLAWDNKSSA